MNNFTALASYRPLIRVSINTKHFQCPVRREAIFHPTWKNQTARNVAETLSVQKELMFALLVTRGMIVSPAGLNVVGSMFYTF